MKPLIKHNQSLNVLGLLKNGQDVKVHLVIGLCLEKAFLHLGYDLRNILLFTLLQTVLRLYGFLDREFTCRSYSLDAQPRPLILLSLSDAVMIIDLLI